MTAAEKGLVTLKAENLKSTELYDKLRSIAPDLIVVIAFRILPPEMIAIPHLGAVNIHASLLPRYRGAAPINWALINGETETGLTAFYLKRKVDTGDIIHQENTKIKETENFDSLHDRLSEMAGPFLIRTLELIENGTTPSAQDNSAATPAPKISPFDALIDFGLPAKMVVNFVRGLSTRPGAYTFFRGKKLKVLSAAVSSAEDLKTPSDLTLRPGTVTCANKEIRVRCADKEVALLEVVPEGKKPMDGRSFVNGFRPKSGEILGKITIGVKE